MNSSTSRTRFARTVAITGAVLLGACASLDYSPDLDEARGLVTDRTRIEFGWSDPWEPRSIAWPRHPLSADDVARLALQNHAGMRAAIESIASARADWAQAHLLPNPVLNFTLGIPLENGLSQPAMGSLLQPIASLWQRPAAIGAADSRLRAAILSVSDAALMLVTSAKIAHAELVFAERDLDLERVALEVANSAFALIERQFDEGEATALLRNRAELDVFEAEMHLTMATVRRDRAVRTLLERCGVADRLETPSVSPTATKPPEWLAQLDERGAIALAERQRLDLAAAHALASGAIDSVRLAELQRIRSVSLGLGLQRNFAGNEALGPTIMLELPLLDDGRARIASAEAMARAAAAELEGIRQNAWTEVRSAWVQLRGDLAHLEHTRMTLKPLAIHNRELAQRALDEGVGSRVDLLDARQREIHAQLEQNRVELTFVRSFFELERAAGGRLTILSEEAE